MIQILKAEIKDAEIIAKNARNAYSKEIFDFCDKNMLNTYPTADEVKSDIINHIYYKFVLDNIIIGGVYLVESDLGIMSIEDFCISPEFQNKGYGAYIIDKLEYLHSNIKTWVLTTPTYSVRNQHLYEKNGYKQVKIDDYDGIVCFYYKKQIL